MRFTKMHGIGNDYIYVDCMDGSLGGESPTLMTDDKILSKLAIALSDRHKGIGADGLILIMPSDDCDARMRMFNADGSEGKMCGNAVRCIGKYLYDHHYVANNTLTLETLSGVKYLTLRVSSTDGKVENVKVNMGCPVLEPARIPVRLENWQPFSLDIDGASFNITPVSMGNPHGVIFVDEITDKLVHEVGPKIERHPVWPDRANVEFVRLLGTNKLEMRVWERGSGETMACGTGSCAAAVAAVLHGKADASQPIIINLLGGDLTIEWGGIGKDVIMSGSASEVFTGEMNIESIIKE